MSGIKKYFKEEFINDLKYDPFGMFCFGTGLFMLLLAIASFGYVIWQIIT